MRWHGDADGGKTPGKVHTSANGPAAQHQDVGFVEVAVVSSKAVVTVAARPTVISPSEFRVEGRDLPGIVTILRALS